VVINTASTPTVSANDNQACQSMPTPTSGYKVGKYTDGLLIPLKNI
jgi:hypothetical protein